MEITITCKWADDENELTAVVPSFALAEEKLAVMERYVASKLKTEPETI